MFGYIAAFAGGIVAAEVVRLIFNACLNEAIRKYDKEKRDMQLKYNRLMEDYNALEASWNCKQAREQGRATGRKLTDAERFAENIAQKNIQFRSNITNIQGGNI